MNKAYLSLGSNQGNRQESLSKAIQAFEKMGEIVKQSTIIETAAWGKTDQANFLNQIILLKTKLSPEELLQACQKIENELGRVRREKWGPRTLDIDILFYNDLVLDSHNLKIPHPYISQREFILKPFAEISPNFIHPILKQTIAELLEKLSKSL